MRGHGFGNGFPDLGEFDFPGAEAVDGDFVGGVVDGGESAASEACGAGESEGGEIRGAGGGKF